MLEDKFQDGLNNIKMSETEKISAMDNLMKWLPENLPSGKPTRLVHGDFGLTNGIVDDTTNEIASISTGSFQLWEIQ